MSIFLLTDSKVSTTGTPFISFHLSEALLLLRCLTHRLIKLEPPCAINSTTGMY